MEIFNGFGGELLALVAAILVLVFSLRALRKKNCTAEINVIWYAFSLIFVLWSCLHLAMDFNLIQLPTDMGKLIALQQKFDELNDKLRDSDSDYGNPADTTDPELIKKRQRDAVQYELARIARKDAELELRRMKREGDPWSMKFFYQKAREYLTDTHAEIGLVATILIVTVAPQFLNYVLAGFSGCAATPRYVWQFEKVAIWSLIKFLAAFGGVFVANATRFYEIEKVNDAQLSLWVRLLLSLDNLLWGVAAVGLAFVIAICQVWILGKARELGNSLPQNPNSLLNRVHRYFTRHLPST